MGKVHFTGVYVCVRVFVCVTHSVEFHMTACCVNNIADYDVCFCRLMSQLADVNIQPSVGMFISDDVSLILTDLFTCVFVHYCNYWTWLKVNMTNSPLQRHVLYRKQVF